jgi:CxxC motif-containing protein (DUF1111 family)
MNRRPRRVARVRALMAVGFLASCGTTSSGPTKAELARSGGAATVFTDGADSFALGIDSLGREERRAFAVGNSLFNENWVTAPASTTARDGLGALFNAQSCSSCHAFDGRAAPPAHADDPVRGLLIRLSIPGADGTSSPDPIYGDQLQDRAIAGVQPEGRIVIDSTDRSGTLADGTPYVLQAPTYRIEGLAYGPLAANVQMSPRIAPAVFGLGLLETVAETDILTRADPDDRNGDGISGRPNSVLNENGKRVLGRFGWKANVATLNQQNANAFHGDIGVTSSVRGADNCTTAETSCRDAISGGEPEVTDDQLQRVTFYTRTLAVPARRNVGRSDTAKGAGLFNTIGCASCHSPEMQTGPSEVVALAGQTIRPYTDLLLHDMGPDLADGRPDGLATGSEWRTPPLWGLGLIDTVNGHTRLLHDGRARDVTEAIVWHGGEAAASQARFTNLTAAQRQDLLAFLESL